MQTVTTEATEAPLLICNHPGCWFELPADCFPADARNIRRAGRATRCYDCESARDRQPDKKPRAGSKAAEVAALKASGAYRQHEPAEFMKERAARAAERKLEADRARSRRAETEYLPIRWRERIKRAEREQAQHGTASFESRKMLERWAPRLGLELPEHLWVYKRPAWY